MRYIYFEDASFYWQSRTIMKSILNEVERAIDLEDEVIELREQVKQVQND